MKKLNICCLAVWLVFFQPALIAGEDPESCLLFSITSESMARLGVVNTDRVSASLQIVNKEGNTFLNQPVSGNSTFFKLVNLKSLPDGVYTVTLNSKGTLYNRKFTVQKAQATIEKIPVRTPPRFKMVDNNSLIISYHNSFSEMVNIFFIRGDEVVFEDRGISALQILKRYPLEKLPRGQYTVQLYSNGLIYPFSMVLE